MSVFISYSAADEQYAVTLDRALRANRFETWFAPKNIEGGESFAKKIGKELSPHKHKDITKRAQEDREHLKRSEYFILLLSANSMSSPWVLNELTLAIRRKMPMQILQIDNSRITEDFDYLLANAQMTRAYHLGKVQLNSVLEKVRKDYPSKGQRRRRPKEKHQSRITYKKIGIYPIASGDPYYVAGETLIVSLGKGKFFLAPPEDLLKDPGNEDYLSRHSFNNKDYVFGQTLEQVCSKISIPELRSMIEDSRRKVFLQFLHQENGCYFNNQKYGVSRISRFERTEDIVEKPMLRIEMYLTDYYTHRVMKDVCKKLVNSHWEYIRELDYQKIDAEKIFFTSLGVNLLLCEANKKDEALGKVILTSRSTNAAETYGRYSYSLSVIEGISKSDYDMYARSVNVEFAVYRGLKEELGVDDSYVSKDSLKFYSFFVNSANLEMGLSCSIELKQEYTLEKDIRSLHGKDEMLEVSGKRIEEIKNLDSFVYNNLAAINSQTVYTICTFLETLGIFLLDRRYRTPVQDVKSVIAKDGQSALCGDTYVWGDHFIAVIDGATPKGEMLWDGKKGDVFVSHLVADAIVAMNPEYTAQEAVSYINGVVRQAYESHGVQFEQLLPAERLQCSILVYSTRRYEVWSFGDCMLRINQKDYVNIKEGDKLFAALRAFCIQIERDHRGCDIDEVALSLYGREQILPYLKSYTSLANRDVPFGYDVIDGGNINPEHVKVYTVQRNDSVIMASDGYPRLFDTFEETEKFLKDALEADPTCIDQLRGTKGIAPGNVSFDDRTFVSFCVK